MCLGEMLVGPKRVLFMDEISTGLDSSTTYQVCSPIASSRASHGSEEMLCGCVTGLSCVTKPRYLVTKLSHLLYAAP